MSDTFDHELDAWESYDQTQEYGDNYFNDRDEPFERDPLYYHQKFTFLDIVEERPTAIRFCFKQGLAWVPRSLCRKLKRKKRTVFIWKKFDFHYIKENVDERTDSHGRSAERLQCVPKLPRRSS